MPDSPESYASLPEDVRTFLTGLPTAWDETRLLAGYPGEYVVIARRSGKDWYIAGINGTEEKLAVELDPAKYGIKGACQLVLDGDSDRDLVSTEVDAPVTKVICRSRGGFVMKTL